jgi:hypothetical protein
MPLPWRTSRGRPRKGQAVRDRCRATRRCVRCEMRRSRASGSTGVALFPLQTRVKEVVAWRTAIGPVPHRGCFRRASAIRTSALFNARHRAATEVPTTPFRGRSAVSHTKMSGITAANPSIIGERYQNAEGHSVVAMSIQPTIVVAADLGRSRQGSSVDASGAAGNTAHRCRRPPAPRDRQPTIAQCSPSAVPTPQILLASAYVPIKRLPTRLPKALRSAHDRRSPGLRACEGELFGDEGSSVLARFGFLKPPTLQATFGINVALRRASGFCRESRELLR